MEIKKIKTICHILFTLGFLIYFALIWYRNGRQKPFDHLNIALAPNSFIAGLYLVILSIKYEVANPAIQNIEQDLFLYCGIAGACMTIFGAIKIVQIYHDICGEQELKKVENQAPSIIKTKEPISNNPYNKLLD